jgi:predicted nucleotide-binding protein
MLRKLFSDDSIQTEYDRSNGFTRIGDVLNNYRRSTQAKTASLRAILGRIELFDEPQIAIAVGPRLAITGSHKVFIVHGHDNEIKTSVARLVEGLGLNAVILHEQTDGGKTIIEKLETLSASAAYAVVLLTPDDFGHVKNKPDASRARARQNVILELGLFIGLIGRARVCALVKGDLERPSDLDGVVYTPIDDGGSWKYKLAKEMQAAGLKVDMNEVR